MDSVVSAQSKNFSGNRKEACNSSWSRIGSLKSFTRTIPWNLAKFVKIFRGIIVRRHHTDQKQMGLLREQYAEWKKTPLQYCCNKIWMKIGWQIVWKAIPICETFKISCLMGRHHTIDVLGNHSKDRIFHLVHWSSITFFYCERPVKNPSIWQESLNWTVPRIRFVRGWNLEVWRTDCRHWGVGDDGRIGHLLKRLNAKEVLFRKEKGEFIFPIADGRIKTIGGDQDLRTSTLVRHRPIQGESHLDFLGESERFLPQPQDSLPGAGEAINDCWSMSGSSIYRHHVEPRVKLYSPREESFSSPLKDIDVSRTTRRNLNVMQERRIDDYCNIDGSRDLADYCTGFTQFIYSIGTETSSRIFVVQGETEKTASDIQARLFMARTLDEIGKKC